jgi:hypothetical protein
LVGEENDECRMMNDEQEEIKALLFIIHYSSFFISRLKRQMEKAEPWQIKARRN